MKATWAKPQVNESLISGKSVIHKTRFLYFFFRETGYDFCSCCPGWISHFRMIKIWFRLVYTTALAIFNSSLPQASFSSFSPPWSASSLYRHSSEGRLSHGTLLRQQRQHFFGHTSHVHLAIDGNRECYGFDRVFWHWGSHLYDSNITLSQISGNPCNIYDMMPFTCMLLYYYGIRDMTLICNEG